MSYSPIDLKLGADQKKTLHSYLIEKFKLSVTARLTQVESDYTRWCKNYEAMPKEKTRTTPFPGAANFIPRLIGMHTDILSARIIGLLFGTKPFWRPKTLIRGKEELQTDDLLTLGDWMEFVTFSGMNWFEAIDLTCNMVVKTGTVVHKYPWKIKELYLGTEGGGSALLKEKKWSKEGVEVDIIPFEDFFPFPITARDLTKCQIKFHRLRFTAEEVIYRKNARVQGQTWWDVKAADYLLNMGKDANPIGAAQQVMAQASGINLTQDVDRPYKVVEATLNYELTPGKLSPIVVLFNPNVYQTELGIFKAWYSPYEKADIDGYADFRIYPRENFFYGNCVPNILEMAQEEQAQIHNGRRDGNTYAGICGWKKKRLAQVGNPSSDWYVGKTWIVDSMDDIEPLQFPKAYNEMIDEEKMLLEIAERYTGISPAMQGFGSGSMGKRGVYANSATLALLSEGNKRLDIFLKRMRNSFHMSGRCIFESHRQFRPSGPEYDQWGFNGEQMKKIFQLASAEADGYAGVFFELAASEASANKEVDRTSLMVMSNTMAAYYQQIVALSTQFLQIPEGSPLKPVVASVLSGARDLANRLCFVFDVSERQRIVPDLSSLLGPAGAQSGRQPPLDGSGMSQSEGSVSRPELSDLAGRITAITGASGAGTAGAQGPGPSRTQ